ncbi:hypothetical protein PG984_013399 [Apiospora sp. TS-2023a]
MAHGLDVPFSLPPSEYLQYLLLNPIPVHFDTTGKHFVGVHDDHAPTITSLKALQDPGQLPKTRLGRLPDHGGPVEPGIVVVCRAVRLVNLVRAWISLQEGGGEARAPRAEAVAPVDDDAVGRDVDDGGSVWAQPTDDE